VRAADDTKDRQVREFYMLVEAATRHDPSSDPDTLLTTFTNTVLSDLKFSPMVDDIDDVDRPWKVVWIERRQPEVGEAVHNFLQLAQQGLLPRLRQCTYEKCRKWFFARFPHKLFHNVKCRDADFKENPVKREKRRAFERRYYRNNWKKPYGKI
jgi:hypothetical protein